MDALNYVLTKFNVALDAPSPVKLRLSRHGGLTRLWAELGYRVGVEVGTEQGKFAEEICRDNPGVALTCVDPYTAYDRYERHQTQEKLDRFFGEATARLSPYNVTFLELTSLEAVSSFPDGSLDFVFIDGNHAFDYVMQDIIAWAPKVRRGGILAGHDYKAEGGEHWPLPFGVIEAVNAYTAAHKVKPWFLCSRDKCPSWFWVKS